ncbi:MAG: aminopeptidase P family protein [Muribaculaceae bacterium]|nr:aminopeptidase P family protein [Muribaculaceae bacterium]
MKNENIAGRLNEFRRLMKENGVAAAIVPQADPHASEYLAEHWQLRAFLSGFTGSAGTLVITESAALLWTDSRYFLQAAQELDGTGIILMKEGVPGTPGIASWLVANVLPGQTVGIDGMLFSVDDYKALESTLRAHDIKLKTDFDVAPQVWAERPELPSAEIFVHDVKYAGHTAKEKLQQVLNQLPALQADAVFISALDEIAWLLNIRSSDVAYNPVATAFLYVSPNGSTLLVNPEKITPEVEEYLKSQGVSVMPYSQVKTFLTSLPGRQRVLMDAQRSVVEVRNLLGERAVEGSSVVALPKACKNEVQIAGIRNAMKRDGVALVHAFMEIEDTLAEGRELQELDVAAILRKHRGASDMFFDESFGTIAGYGPHGAIVHYEADEESSSRIEPHGLLLIDSGAQYLDGTTDITRTISLGEPTELEKRDFTLVMKGHIALGRQIFPSGTRGAQLDALARQYLWMNGLSYLHGTGHGVGHFLNVHEGPQSIRLNNVPTPLMAGMLTSNEPGLYREGIHGIRCENLVLTVPAMTTEFGEFLKFETLTLFPFDLKLFDTSIMTDEEIEWLNVYHAHVREELLPELEGRAAQWLTDKTQPLVRI